jgi:hypothetical protein
MVSLRFIIPFLIFIIAVHALALVNYWYWTYQWFDVPMHFFGGIWVAMVFFWLRQKTRADYDKFWTLINCLGFVVLIGVLLEFAEFLYDVFISSRGYFGFLQLGAADTVGDLFFDLLGGLFFSIIYFIQPRQK